MATKRDAKLAALVTLELAELLEWLSNRAMEIVLETTLAYNADHPLVIRRNRRIETARALAAQIREVLDDSQA